MLRLCAAMLLLLGVHDAHAALLEIKTGDDFMVICKDVYEDNYGKTREEVEMIGFCFGYMEGIRGMSRESSHYCIPNDVASKELIKTVYRFMQNHPEILSRHPYVSVTHSLASAFPCRRGR
jgi:hypothetical protein